MFLYGPFSVLTFWHIEKADNMEGSTLAYEMQQIDESENDKVDEDMYGIDEES